VHGFALNHIGFKAKTLNLTWFRVTFPGSSSTSLLGWDVVISLMPLPQSAGFFLG